MTAILGWLLAGGGALLIALLAIPRELWKRWRARIVDSLDQLLQRLFSRFGTRYRESLLTRLRFTEVKGLMTLGSATPEFDEIYVDVSLAPRPTHQQPKGVLGQPPPRGSGQPIEYFLQRSQPGILAVLGVPGSGKTTLLQRTARQACRRRLWRRRKLPILLYLRDHVDSIIANQTVSLAELARRPLARYGLREPPEWLERRLRRGGCLVLLDGLDEVVREKDRRQVSNWVEDQTNRYSKNRYIITSRPHGYGNAPIAGAAVLQILSFTPEQVAHFVHAWYFAVEQRRADSLRETAQSRAESAANDLLRRLHRTPELDDLTVNPLLLTMIANVHRYRGALPNSRADLYYEICQVVMERRPLGTEVDTDTREMPLRALAFSMMQLHVPDLSRADVIATIATVLQPACPELSAEDYVTNVVNNGLLIERETDTYAFAHLTFQEYLASAHIRDHGATEMLIEYVNDDWWNETTLLYAARSNADAIVETCLESGSLNALELAFGCEEMRRDLPFDLKMRLHELLDSTHDEPELQRLIAKIKIRRRLTGKDWWV